MCGLVKGLGAVKTVKNVIQSVSGSGSDVWALLTEFEESYQAILSGIRLSLYLKLQYHFLEHSPISQAFRHQGNLYAGFRH